MSETGGIGPGGLGGLDPTKVIVLGLIVIADLAVLAVLVALVVWAL